MPLGRIVLPWCAFTSSIPPLTRHPTTMRCAMRWRAAGVDVELFTSRFAYGTSRQRPIGYVRHELFYRACFGRPGGRLRRRCKLAEHVPDMLRYRRHARMPMSCISSGWLSRSGRIAVCPRKEPRRRRPLVLTAHDVLPREPRPGQLAAQRRLYDRFDAIVVHSEQGRARLVEELGVDGDRVHVIPTACSPTWLVPHVCVRPRARGCLRALQLNAINPWCSCSV